MPGQTIVGPVAASLYYVELPEDSTIPGAVAEAARRLGEGFYLVTGVGGLSEAKLAVFDPARRVYRYMLVKPLENHVLEVVSLLGNIACFSGDCYPHLHLAVARRPGEVYAGHLVEAGVKPFLELVLLRAPMGSRVLAGFFKRRTERLGVEELTP